MNKKELKKAKKLAREKISELIFMGVTWPEDDWFELSSTIDLNLWIMRKGLNKPSICKATIYEVKNGHTVTSKWWKIL